MKTLRHLFDNNKAWAEAINRDNPDFFSTLAIEQSPKYLWIGCSDSRVPANQIVSLPPGEVFVHRNIANMVVHSDLNCYSVIQFAVEVLKVEHIIVCGHYGCGGVHASLGNASHGMIDNWLHHIRDVARFHQDELDQLSGEEKTNRLCEINVVEQVRNVCNSTIVTSAWERGANLAVHGWIYNMKTGILKDLDACVTTSTHDGRSCRK